MPIVTPCYPVKNAAPAVTKSTLKALSNELIRGRVIIVDDHHEWLTQ